MPHKRIQEDQKGTLVRIGNYTYRPNPKFPSAYTAGENVLTRNINGKPYAVVGEETWGDTEIFNQQK